MSVGHTHRKEQEYTIKKFCLSFEQEYSCGVYNQRQLFK